MSIPLETKINIQGLVQAISDSSQAYLEQDESARTTIIAHARSLITELEHPNETVTWLAWAEPTRRAAISTAIHLNVFPLLSSPKTASEIAASCGASLSLVQRLLRHLAATSVITENGLQSYSSTALSRSLCDPRCRAALTYSAGLTQPVLSRLPDYLASINYRDPRGQGTSPFQFAFDTKLSPWAWASTKPEIARAFALHMSGYHSERPSWMDAGFYPLEERLVNGCRYGKEEVLLVDVGGGLGHDLEELRRKRSSSIGERRLILQELLEQTVRGAKRLRPWLEAMAYNFFTPQPIKGARAYYLHSVLHDWPDEQCRQILRILRNAMEPGYSKILINENIVLEAGASWKVTALDWTMMAMAASAERTEAQWRELIRSAGLEVCGIWTKDPACESLIEVGLDEKAKL